jgi:hypothetical protein
MMLDAAFVGLGVAVLLGAALAISYLYRGTVWVAPWLLSTLHGCFAVGGLCCLLLSLRGPPRGLEQGTATFGAISAVLFVLAALVGIAVLLIHRVKRRRAGTLIGVHATLAVGGFVILAAYLLA